jgi:hypothetical protein
MSVVRDGKNVNAAIAAVMNPLTNPCAGLRVVKIDYTDAMLKLFQHPHNLTRVDVLINVVHDMGPGRLPNQGLQTVSGSWIHIYA